MLLTKHRASPIDEFQGKSITDAHHSYIHYGIKHCFVNSRRTPGDHVSKDILAFKTISLQDKRPETVRGY